MKIIVFANHKGGVGKTFCTLATAEILAREMKKQVLVVDMDSQGNSGESLSPQGVDVTDLVSVDTCLEYPEKTPNCIYDSWLKDLYFIPSNIRMEQPFPSYASGAGEPPFVYRIPLDALHNVLIRAREVGTFDFAIIDTAPSLGPATQTAIHAADALYLPCSPVKHAVFGVPSMVTLAKRIGCKHPSVIITMTDNRVRMDKIGRQMLVSRFPVTGEIPKMSRLADNLATKKYVLNKVDSDVRNIMISFVEKITDI